MPVLISARGVSGAATAGAAPEIWSCGTWWRATDGSATEPSQAAMDTLAQASKNAWAAFFNDTGAGVQSNFYLDEARTYLYGESYVPGSGSTGGSIGSALKVGYSSSTNRVPGSSAPTHPLQCTTAVSLVAEGRVKPKYGRFYLPTQFFPVAADGKISLENAQTLSAVVKNLLSALDTACTQNLGEDYELSIISRTGTAGQFLKANPVRATRIGRVIDTQRRRRNALEEAYVEAVYP